MPPSHLKRAEQACWKQAVAIHCQLPGKVDAAGGGSLHSGGQAGRRRALPCRSAEREPQLTSPGFGAGGWLQSLQVIVKSTTCPVQPVTASSF